MSKKIRNYLIFSIIFLAVLFFLIIYIRSAGCAGIGFNLLIQPVLVIWSIVTSIIVFSKESVPSASLRFFLIFVSLIVIFFLLKGIAWSILDIDSIKVGCPFGP